MSLISSGDCLVGSKLRGGCSGKLPRSTKTNFIILQRYNTKRCVLEGYAECKIIDKVTKLSITDYLVCLEKIRENGYNPKEIINSEIKGNEISCEFQTQSKNEFKSIIALGILVRSFSKGGYYKMNETFMGVPKYTLK